MDEARKGEGAGASEWSQREAVRHRRSKAEVAKPRTGEFESINRSPRSRTFEKVSDAQSLEERSRREWSRWESSDIDEARRVSERERANQSKPNLRHVPECQRLTRLQQSFPAGIEPTFKV